MITIKEIRPPKKVSGVSSLWVTMKYDERAIAEIKSLGGARWHKKEGAWEVPMSKLQRLLDSFTFWDDIELSLLPDETDEGDRSWELTDDEIGSFKMRPFSHQIDAVNYGLNPAHERWLLLDSMGLGKTNEIIWLAETLKRRGKIDHCLIICGVDSLRQNWKREIEKFSTESCTVLGERISKTGSVSYMTVPERCKILKGEIKEFFVIVNAATLRSDEFIDALRKSKTTFGMVAVDEAHCVTGDARISTDEGSLTVDELRKAEDLPLIKTYNESTGEEEFKEIAGIAETKSDEDLLELAFEEKDSARTLKCTADHLIFTANRGWVKAEDLADKDDIKIENAGQIQLTARLISKKKIAKEKTYDISVKDNHNFFANGILVHNCFATKSSLQGGNLLKIKADYQVAATGTPITNSPISAYMPLSWTGNDKSTLTDYKGQYCVFGGFKDSQIIGYKDLDMLKEEIDSCSLRRTLDQVREDMPKKTVVAEVVEMCDAHRKFYEAVRKGVKEEVDKVELNSSNLLALTTRLRQATADPGILTTEKIPSSKILRAEELTRELVASGEKVVVLSCFKEPIYRLAGLLSDLNPLIGTGDQKDADVAKSVERFQSDPGSMIFLGTHSKCGTGITLNAASHMICLDEMWTAAKNNQSFDRIYRVSNTRPAFITVLTCQGTIDERVHEIAQKKQDLSDYVIDGKEEALGKSLQREMAAALREL